MNSENVKGKPLTKEDTRILLALIESSKVITTKNTNATSNKMKNEEWINLAERFNATANWPRTPQQLRLKWENLKKNSRKRSTIIKRNQMKTNDGPPDYIPPDEILDKVASILRSSVSAFSVSFEENREDLRVEDENSDGSSIDDAVLLADATMSVGSPYESDGVGSNSVGNIAVGGSPGDCFTNNQLQHCFENKFKSNEPKRLCERKGKSRITDENRSLRNAAIAEYYILKTQILNNKLQSINLETENLKLKNSELELKNEKLKLEVEKLKNL